jgi:hypothetical protein
MFRIALIYNKNRHCKQEMETADRRIYWVIFDHWANMTFLCSLGIVGGK